MDSYGKCFRGTPPPKPFTEGPSARIVFSHWTPVRFLTLHIPAVSVAFSLTTFTIPQSSCAARFLETTIGF